MKCYVGPLEKGRTITLRDGRTVTLPNECWHAPAGAAGLLDFRSIPGHAGAENGLFLVGDDVTLDSSYRLFGEGHIPEVVPRESDRAVFASMIGAPTVDGDTLMDWVDTALTRYPDPLGDARVRPLMPSRRGRSLDLEIHVGGLVRRRAFDLSAPEAANVVAVVQEDYRKVRAAALRGEIGQHQLGRGLVIDPLFHSKYLGWVARKFNINNPEDVFIPGDLPRELAIAPETVISDNFNGSDSGTPGIQLSWTEILDTVWSNTSNKAQCAPSGGGWAAARADSALSGADHYAKGVVAGYDTNDLFVHGGTIIRKDNTGTVTCYAGQAYLTHDAFITYKLVAGAQTFLDWTDRTIGASVNLEFRVEGSTLKIYDGATLVATVTDSAISSGNYCGVVGLSQSSSPHLTVDDWEAGDIEAGHPAIRRFGGVEHARMGMRGVY